MGIPANLFFFAKIEIATMLDSNSSEKIASNADSQKICEQSEVIPALVCIKEFIQG